MLMFLLGLLYLLIEHGCDRGVRLPGVSWFDVIGEMRGTSKKARGRIQQKPQKRKARR